MKKILTLVLMGMMLIPASYAQKGLQLGANFGYYSSNIVNQNIWGLGREYDYELSMKPSFGFDVGYNFNEKMGIYTGFWRNNLGQNYVDEYEMGDLTAMSNWERSLDFKYNMIPVMLRFSNSLNTVNFLGGIGMSFAFLSEATQEWTVDGKTYSDIIENPITDKEFDVAATDVTDRYESSDIFLNVELGARIFFMEELYMDVSFFGGYGLKDINAAEWQIGNTDGEYNASHNAFGGLKIGVAYVLFGD
jgi:hypothetical protein